MQAISIVSKLCAPCRCTREACSGGSFSHGDDLLLPTRISSNAENRGVLLSALHLAGRHKLEQPQRAAEGNELAGRIQAAKAGKRVE